LRALPMRAPEQLVYIEETKEGTTDRSEASYPDFLDWRSQSRSFDALEGFDPTNVTIIASDEPVRADGARTTAGFLRMLGVTPVVGRTFTEGEDAPGGTAVVVLSYGFWQRWFAGDRAVVGKELTVDGIRRTIIGILPSEFAFAPVGDAELWMPLERSAETRAQRFNHWLRVVGRLKPDVSIELARSDMGAVMQRLAAQYPQSNAGRGIWIESLRETIVGPVRPTLLALFGAVALVLLIACANIASLLLARAITRGREMAVRTALGAGRSRLIRQLLTESFLLSLGGGLLGVFVAQRATPLLVGALPDNVRASMQYARDLGVDGGVLLYLTIIALATGAAFGLAPALYASRPTLSSLISGDRRATVGTAAAGMRSALVTLEVALTVVLLVGAGLLTRSLTRLLHVDPGFNPSQALTLRVALPQGRYDSGHARRQFFETLIARGRGIPGVQSVGAVSNLPLNGGGTNTFHIDAHPEPDVARRPEAVMREVAGDYFQTLGIRLLQGRALDARDDSAAMQAIMISESVAKRHFPDGTALGARFRFYAWADQPWTVVGVVADVKTTRLDEEAPPTIYYSHLQGGANRMSLVLRSELELTSLANTVRGIVRSMDPALPIYAVRTMEREITESPAVYARRYPLVLLGSFAVAALILAIVGIAGVMSYSVSQRLREMGIRMALGAPQRAILGLVIRQAGALALTGVAIGIVAAFAGTRWLESVLYGTSATDPLTYASIATLIVGVALVASYVPARRATRVDPAMVLRSE